MARAIISGINGAAGHGRIFHRLVHRSSTRNFVGKKFTNTGTSEGRGEEQYLARKRKFSSFAVVLSFFFSFLFLFSLESSEMIWRECEWLNCVIRC